MWKVWKLNGFKGQLEDIKKSIEAGGMTVVSPGS